MSSLHPVNRYKLFNVGCVLLFVSFAAGCSGSIDGASTSTVRRSLDGVKAVTGPAMTVDADPAVPPAPTPRGRVKLEPIGGFTHGESLATSAAEISAYDPISRRLFVVNCEKTRVDVLDLADPTSPQLIASCDTAPYGRPTSVAVKKGLIAAAVAANSAQELGKVLLLTADGKLVKTLDAGYHPDMLTFTPDGHWLLVANEAEPQNDYAFDAEGSVCQIDTTGGWEAVTQERVTKLDFSRFNGQRASLDPSVRIFGKNADVAHDLEPEYIATSPDSKTAWIVCQENNAIAIADLEAKQITRLVGLGFKDHSLDGNWLDASNDDDKIRIRPWPVKGMYQPDAMVCAAVGDRPYLFTVNEGDHRAYAGYNEMCKVRELKLNPQYFPNAAELQRDENIGSLRTTTANGDHDGDGLFDEIFCYGGRSFAIWTPEVEKVFDSGDQFERITAERYPKLFNSDHESDRFDDRSDNKGCEPEGIAVGAIDSSTYAFVGLERMGGVMVYDVSDPKSPVFESYFNSRNETGQLPVGDLGPEGVLFIPAADSPNQQPLLVVCHEITGTTRIYRVVTTPTEPAANDAAPKTK